MEDGEGQFGGERDCWRRMVSTTALTSAYAGKSEALSGLPAAGRLQALLICLDLRHD